MTFEGWNVSLLLLFTYMFLASGLAICFSRSYIILSGMALTAFMLFLSVLLRRFFQCSEASPALSAAEKKAADN